MMNIIPAALPCLSLRGTLRKVRLVRSGLTSGL
jgi:hypothetical protein